LHSFKTLWTFLATIGFLAACQPSLSGTTISSPAPPTLAATSLPASSTPAIPPQVSPQRPTDTQPPPETPNPSPTPTIPAAIIELAGAELPPGFSLIKFAGLYRPTAFTFDAQGRLYATSVDGNVYRLTDNDLDGRADEQIVFASGFFLPLGVTVHLPTGDIYLSHQGAITRLRDTDGDGRADETATIASGLPTGRHQNDNLKFGPDGWLYMGIGSTCDACFEADPRSATIMRFNIETGAAEVFASGLRNPFDVAFHPLTGDLFATDNGRDDLGLDVPQEELNHIVQDGNYGFPGCWDAGDQSGCQNFIPAVAFFEAHSSANGLDFENGNRFPIEFRHNAFVSIYGSLFKDGVQTGVARVILTETEETYTGLTEWFARFPAGAQPLPLLFGPDGALYVGDYSNDTIYRISYGIP